jgi:hypothetical protein
VPIPLADVTIQNLSALLAQFLSSGDAGSLFQVLCVFTIQL